MSRDTWWVISQKAPALDGMLILPASVAMTGGSKWNRKDNVGIKYHTLNVLSATAKTWARTVIFN